MSHVPIMQFIKAVRIFRILSGKSDIKRAVQIDRIVLFLPFYICLRAIPILIFINIFLPISFPFHFLSSISYNFAMSSRILKSAYRAWKSHRIFFFIPQLLYFFVSGHFRCKHKSEHHAFKSKKVIQQYMVNVIFNIKITQKTMPTSRQNTG